MNVATSIGEWEPQRFLLTVKDYQILHEAGAFVGRPKVELIEGVIVTVSPQTNLHSFAKSELALRLGLKLRELGSPLKAVTEGTVALSPDSAADPDITITSDRSKNGYIERKTAALVIEVSDSSLRYDLGGKAQLYARCGVPEYWVVAVRKRQVHRHWSPSGEEYQNKDVIEFGDPIESVTIPGLAAESDGLI